MAQKDLPGAATPSALARVIEAVQILLGFRGEPGEKAVLWNDLAAGGLATLRTGRAGGSAPGTISLPGTGGSTADEEPDLTPPPTPASLVVTGGFATLFVEWPVALYTQGHGHLQTNIYAVKKLAADPTLPTFADASLVYEATGALTIATLASELGTRWHVWAKYKSVDGVESTDPVGGVNGQVATIGKIGNVDLGPLIIEAQNIALKAVDSTRMTMSDFSTIADNPTFEAGDVGWVKNGAWAIVNSPGTALNGAWHGQCASGVPAVLQNNIVLPTIVGDEFYAEAMIATPGGTAAESAYVRMSGVNAAGAEAAVWFSNGIPGGTAAYTKASLSLTVPAGVVGLRLQIATYLLTGTARVDNVRFQRKLTLNHLAANSIAVGTLAVEDGAIRRALIALAAIDDARIANLSAAKLTVGDGTVGGNLRSTNYAAGVSGWQIQPNGYAEFSDVVIRGIVYASGGSFTGAVTATSGSFTGAVTATSGSFTGSITAGAGTIGGIVIGGADVRSSGYVAGTTGFRINADGSVECYNLTASGNITANALNAATGTIGALTVGTTGHVKGGQSAYNTGVGFFLGYSGGAYKFSIGDPAASYMAWDGSTLMFNKPTFDTFSVSVVGGNVALSGITGLTTFTRSLSITGGRTPFTYLWFCSNGKTAVGDRSNMWVSAGTTTSSTVTGASFADSDTNYARFICLVTDANGRMTAANFSASVAHGPSGGGAGGGDSP